jgi:hypothetical protein
MVGCTKLAHGPATVWSTSAGQLALFASQNRASQGSRKMSGAIGKSGRWSLTPCWFVKHTPWNADVRHSACVELG